MNIMRFPCYVLVVLLAYSNMALADTLSYRDKAAQCSEHGNNLCWRYCLVAQRQADDGQKVEFGKQCDAEYIKQFAHTPYQSKTDSDYLPPGSTWFDNDVVGVYRRYGSRLIYIIDAPLNLEWKEKCAGAARIEDAVIKSLQKNGKTLQRGMKVRLSKIQVKATSGNQFACTAGKVEVLD